MPASVPPAAVEILLDLLLDLQHDLGKYIMMPLNFLPKQAGLADLKQALRRALLATLDHQQGPKPARELWAEFVAEVPAEAKQLRSYDQLVIVVERALAWEAELNASVPDLDRAAIEADLGAVTPAIRELIAELDEA